jgi:hypothetical protein
MGGVRVLCVQRLEEESRKPTALPQLDHSPEMRSPPSQGVSPSLLPSVSTQRPCCACESFHSDSLVGCNSIESHQPGHPSTDLLMEPAQKAGVKRGREAGDSAIERDAPSVPADSEQDAELKAQLAALEKERQDLLQGGSMTYHERCAVFESVKAEAIAQAVLHRQAQLRSIEALFEYQQHVATTACEVRSCEGVAERCPRVIALALPVHPASPAAALEAGAPRRPAGRRLRALQGRARPPGWRHGRGAEGAARPAQAAQQGGGGGRWRCRGPERPRRDCRRGRRRGGSAFWRHPCHACCCTPRPRSGAALGGRAGRHG